VRILLVQPTTYYPDGRPLRSKTRWLVGITLPYLAGLTPQGIQVDLVDDRLKDIPYHRTYDLVGITATCATATRAYEIAREFRRRRVPVVMGGFHATLAPEECRQHADALVLGEAEEAWPRLLRDFQAGRLQELYRAEKLSDLQNLPVPRYDLLDLKRFGVELTEQYILQPEKSVTAVAGIEPIG